jgi:hypothetical protein
VPVPEQQQAFTFHAETMSIEEAKQMILAMPLASKSDYLTLADTCSHIRRRVQETNSMAVALYITSIGLSLLLPMEHCLCLLAFLSFYTMTTTRLSSVAVLFCRVQLRRWDGSMSAVAGPSCLWQRELADSNPFPPLKTAHNNTSSLGFSPAPAEFHAPRNPAITRLTFAPECGIV